MVLFCLDGSDNYYRDTSIDKDVFFLSLGFFIIYMLLEGDILNQFSDKKIIIINNDGNSVYIPVIARQKSQTKKDIKKILESVKEINPDIEIKDTSILEMIIIIVICLSMIGISIMNLYGSFKA